MPTAPTYMLSVDPGLSGTGVVFWFNGKPQKARVYRPLASELKGSDNELLQRARSLAHQVMFTSPNPARVHLVVIEFPEFHESLKGRTARSTGSVDKLAFLIGVLAARFPPHWTVALPKVRDWKGQLPKDVVISRMTNRYGAATCLGIGVKSHAWDALGIGDWALKQEW